MNFVFVEVQTASYYFFGLIVADFTEYSIVSDAHSDPLSYCKIVPSMHSRLHVTRTVLIQ